MHSFLISTLVVSLAEIGDKTQLLALVLASRYRRPIPIILGILFATLANHGLAGILGNWLQQQLDPHWLRLVLGLSFIAMAAWTLVPDKLDDETPLISAANVFWVTLFSFFMVEIGDKTQVATVALALRFDDLVSVVLGTTLGMMLANVPAVLLGQFAADKLPLKLIRSLAAAVFAVLGLWALIFGLSM